MPLWFQGTIKYQKEEIVTDRQGDQVRLKTIKETYLYDAVSYTDAEARIYKCVPDNTPDFQVDSISKQPISDIFSHDLGGIWFKCKVVFLTEDDKGREKKIKNTMLVNADNVKEAFERLEESLRPILMPYEVHAIDRTPILEIFPFDDEPNEYATSENA